jgi:hypothetical protein
LYKVNWRITNALSGLIVRSIAHVQHSTTRLPALAFQ